MQRKIWLMTYGDVKRCIEEGKTTLIIPVGALEAHGPHLPLGTDTIIPEKLAEVIAEEIDALIAPAMPYGVTTSLLVYAGGSTISEETLRGIIVDIITHFSRHGFDIFIILNGHGGNIGAIRDAMRLLWRDRRIKCIAVHWWIFVKNITKEIFGEIGGHGGLDETAMILAINPELVKRADTTTEAYTFEEGIEIYPNPGSIILYEKGRGLPKFDLGASKKYFLRVSEYISKRLKEIIGKLKKV